MNLKFPMKFNELSVYINFYLRIRQGKTFWNLCRTIPSSVNKQWKNFKILPHVPIANLILSFNK